jgi:hypothetical protein
LVNWGACKFDIEKRREEKRREETSRDEKRSGMCVE